MEQAPVAPTQNIHHNRALTGLLIASVFVTAFLPVVPADVKPYLGAIATALAGVAALFHVPNLGAAS